MKKNTQHKKGLARAVTFVFNQAVRIFDISKESLLSLKAKVVNQLSFKTEQRQKSTAGFAILFAVLISSLLLVLGFSVFSISIKELFISNFTTDSKQAIFAAKSAIDCVLYWQLHGEILGPTNISWDSIMCGGTKVRALRGTPEYVPGGPAKSMTFQMYYSTLTLAQITAANGTTEPCAIVDVNVMPDSDSENDRGYIASTTVKGYNMCRLDQGNKRLVEKSYIISI